MVNAHEVPTVEEAELALQQVEEARKEKEVHCTCSSFSLLHFYMHACTMYVHVQWKQLHM